MLVTTPRHYTPSSPVAVLSAGGRTGESGKLIPAAAQANVAGMVANLALNEGIRPPLVAVRACW